MKIYEMSDQVNIFLSRNFLFRRVFHQRIVLKSKKMN